jgi:hypothetical protein|tara:strand:- start:693 stop:1313 length:621 start_codon:yes stop_codon:yes gene_type:complete
MKQQVKISKVKANASNPRIIKNDKFKKLVKSIKEFPEMLKLRPIVVDEDMIVLGGNMRLKASKDAGLKEVWIEVAEGLTEEQKKEFIVKDNVGFGEWDWDILANEWDNVKLEDWGLDLRIDDVIDNLEEDEEIELPQSVQLEPPKEYVIIICEPNSVEWEELKMDLKLGVVRKGGYKKGSAFDAISIERVLTYKNFKDRYDNSDTE